MVVLDLFSGAGGLSEGFFRIGAKFAGHIETDSHACKTLRTRAAYWKLKKAGLISIYEDYLLKKITTETLWEKAGVLNSKDVIEKEISNDTFKTIVSDIYENMQLQDLKKVDLVIGGPPCQAYSIVGRARMKDAVTCDPRNYLYKYYVRFLKEFQPKMFVFENVPGILSAANGQHFQDIKDAIAKAGYHMEPKELVASDFGVLQDRKRIIIIGWKKNDRRRQYKYPEFETIENKYLVKDVFNDLPKTKPDNIIEGKGLYRTEPSQYLIDANIRNVDFDILTQHETRMHNERDLEIYRIAIEKWNKEKKRLCYKELSEEYPKLCTHKNKTSFTNRFNVVKADQPASHTVLAHMAMDGHYYIHPDITQLRSLSVREAARLQSFPDDFYFEGPRTAQFRQIGNAVPPKMAEQIAKKIKEILQDYNRL